MKQVFSLIYALSFIFSLNSLPSLAQSNKIPILYRCKEGKTFQAEIIGNTVNLQLKRDQILKLTSVATGSGVKYTDGKVTLYTKGEDAFIESNKKTTHRGCTSRVPTNQDALGVYYNCDSQIAPFPRKEDLSLVEAEKLLIQRDGDLFIYRCFPR
jgi:membrane-bound inhibitor of C-type lysozyme